MLSLHLFHIQLEVKTFKSLISVTLIYLPWQKKWHTISFMIQIVILLATPIEQVTDEVTDSQSIAHQECLLPY